MKKKLVLLTAILALAGLSGCSATNGDNMENDLAVVSVELDQTFAKLEAGESLTLVPTIHFKDDKEVDCYKEWRSSNGKIAFVDDAGVVTALKPGNVAITFIAGFKSAACSITVPDNNVTPITPVDPDNPPQPGEFTISLDTQSITLGLTDTFKLNATTSEQATVSWSSDAEGVATVDQNGLVSAVAEGDAVITASANGKTATCAVSVVGDGGQDLPPSDDMTVKVYFFIDYNNVDEDDVTGRKLLAKFWWYEDRPIAQSGKVPSTPSQAPTPEFPYFAGWSTHPIIDSKNDLLNLDTYKVEDEGAGRSYIYIYGIWTDVQGGMSL